MIVTLDGPAGTGKSTVAKRVAEQLGFDFLDTGAMYRAVGLAALRRDADMADARELAWIAGKCRIEFDWEKTPPELVLNGEPVGGKLRDAAPTAAASHVAAVPEIREILVEQQQKIGANAPNLVTEGRDQGTVVFPDAEYKFFLTADPEERARRRADQLRRRGEKVDVDCIRREMIERDRRDSTRKVAPLKAADDAIVIDTTELTEDDVVRRIVGAVQQALA
ncbi:MAG: (d)CMP kinase [Planctomycetota bacterium]